MLHIFVSARKNRLVQEPLEKILSEVSLYRSYFGLALLSFTEAVPHNYVDFTKTTFGECEETYEYQKYFLWVGGFPSPSPPMYIYFSDYETHEPLGTSYLKAVICIFQVPAFFTIVIVPHIHSLP